MSYLWWTVLGLGVACYFLPILNALGSAKRYLFYVFWTLVIHNAFRINLFVSTVLGMLVAELINLLLRIVGTAIGLEGPDKP